VTGEKVKANEDVRRNEFYNRERRGIGSDQPKATHFSKEEEQRRDSTH
jgi:hypothetical protein